MSRLGLFLVCVVQYASVAIWPTTQTARGVAAVLAAALVGAIAGALTFRSERLSEVAALTGCGLIACTLPLSPQLSLDGLRFYAIFPLVALILLVVSVTLLMEQSGMRSRRSRWHDHSS